VDVPCCLKAKLFDQISNKNTAAVFRILVVDDDQINIAVLRRYLESYQDLCFDVAFNGAQALEIIKSNAEKGIFYDVIVMDCNMPIMDGFEATSRISVLIQEGMIPSVPVIAATANSSQLDYEKCFQHGMSAYLSKPFTRTQLRNKIDECLSRRPASLI
jgi:two-component system, sensor histidine kinase and response regulator